jgi:topoisomerase IA-like protein
MGPQAKMEIQIDEQNTYLVGKYGPVIKCVENQDDGKKKIIFKPVRTDLDITTIEKGITQIDDIVDSKKKQTQNNYIIGKHEGHDVILKKGKFGLFITWDKNTKTLKELGNRPIENITFAEIQKYLNEGSNVIREINSNTSIRKGPKGDYIFYKKTNMKKPKFYDIKSFITELSEDYKICDIDILKSWISDKYDI